MAIKPSILSNSYVKFVRTNFAIWENLLNRDKDTLYFVVNEGSTNGSLYLGEVLIATSIDEGLNLNDLKDVLIGTDIDVDHVLVADENGKWVNKNIYDFMPVTMTGASADADGLGGLVPQPAAGQQNLYLQGNGTWTSPTAALESTVGTLNEKLTEVENNLNAVRGSDLNLSMRAVAEEVAAAAVAEVVDSAPEAFDTLKEIAAWIAGEDGEVAVNAEQLITQVNTLNTTIYGDGTADNPGLESRVGTLEPIVDELVTGVNTLFTTVGDETKGLVKQVNDNTSDIGENATQIAALWDALKWNELVETDE